MLAYRLNVNTENSRVVFTFKKCVFSQFKQYLCSLADLALSMAYEYSEGLDKIARERYKTKLAAAGLAICPYKLEAGQWQNDPTKWPDVQYPDIYSYLIDTPGIYEINVIFTIKNYCKCHNFR